MSSSGRVARRRPSRSYSPPGSVQQRQGAVVGRRHPAAPVEPDHADPAVLEQVERRGAERPCVDQRLAHPDVVAQMGQQAFDCLDPGGGPAVAVDRIEDRPHDARAGRPVEAHVEAVPCVAADERLVPGRRGLLLRVGVERGGLHHPGVRQTAQARDALVEPMEVLEILALQVGAEPAAMAEAGVEEVDAVRRRAVAGHQEAALRAAERVDRARRRRPGRVVERGRVQGVEDPSERVVPAHRRPASAARVMPGGRGIDIPFSIRRPERALSGAMDERRNGPAESGAAACGAGMDSACNGIFFRCGKVSGLSLERAAVRRSPPEARP